MRIQIGKLAVFTIGIFALWSMSPTVARGQSCCVTLNPVTINCSNGSGCSMHGVIETCMGGQCGDAGFCYTSQPFTCCGSSYNTLTSQTGTCQICFKACTSASPSTSTTLTFKPVYLRECSGRYEVVRL